METNNDQEEETHHWHESSNAVSDIFTNSALKFRNTKPVRRNPNLDKLVLTPLNLRELLWDDGDNNTEESEHKENIQHHPEERLSPISETGSNSRDRKSGGSGNSNSKRERLNFLRRRHEMNKIGQTPLRIVNDGKGINYLEEIRDRRNGISLRNEKVESVRSSQAMKILTKPDVCETNKEKEIVAPLPKCNTDDSFDFDFSTLSLVTPVKQKAVDHNFITPKVGNLKRTPQPVIQYSAKKAAVDHLAIHKNSEVNLSQETLSEPKPDANFKRISVNGIKYIVMNCLGRGGSSEVFNCYNEEKKMHVAIKCVTLANPQSATGYINEVKLLKTLQKCDRIIKMFDYEVLENEKKLYVVLERGGDDLSRILKQLATKQSHIPIYMLIFYWLEMLHAVKQIHMNGIIHSDLKPANFLRAEGGLKLIDFGIATSVETDMTSVYKSNQEGSCNYISPEALNDSGGGSPSQHKQTDAKYKLHFKSDVWSLGCILYQLIYRRTPFEHIKPIWSKLYAIMNPMHEIEFLPAPWVPQRFLTTIKKCLQRNVKLRPSVEDLIKEYEEMLQKL